MCGIVGFVNFKQDISRYRKILINMNNSISKRGPDEEGYYIRTHVALGHKRLIVIDPDGGKQPMQAIDTNSNSTFSIVYNGQIYNTKELRQTLEENGFTFDSYTIIALFHNCQSFGLRWNICYALRRKIYLNRWKMFRLYELHCFYWVFCIVYVSERSVIYLF